MSSHDDDEYDEEDEDDNEQILFSHFHPPFTRLLLLLLLLRKFITFMHEVVHESKFYHAKKITQISSASTRYQLTADEF